MSAVSQIFSEYIPRKNKPTPSGWISFNAPCCIHNGHRADTRKRAGYMNNENGGISYHCFNCGYKCSWQPGRTLSYKIKKIFNWLGVPDAVISQVSLDVIRENTNLGYSSTIPTLPKFKEISLPKFSILLNKKNTKQTSDVQKYIIERSLDLNEYDLYWSPETLYKERFIIPFYFMGKIVGYTARTISKNKIKYITSSQPGFVYGIDSQPTERRRMIVCEGPIDAMLIKSTALLGSEISIQQKLLLDSCKKEIIVVPDRDNSGKKLVDQALEYNWSVSFPTWENNINDIGEAVDKYGRALTLHSILSNIQKNNLKIKLGAKKWFGKNI